MNEEAKKEIAPDGPARALRPHEPGGRQGPPRSTVSWVTQASFSPAPFGRGLKKGSFTYETVSLAQSFALNFLGAGQRTWRKNSSSTRNPKAAIWRASLSN